MTSRKLVLRSERLQELATEDLRQVVAGTIKDIAVAHTLDHGCFTCQTSIDPHKCANA